MGCDIEHRWTTAAAGQQIDYNINFNSADTSEGDIIVESWAFFYGAERFPPTDYTQVSSLRFGPTTYASGMHMKTAWHRVLSDGEGPGVWTPVYPAELGGFYQTTCIRGCPAIGDPFQVLNDGTGNGPGLLMDLPDSSKKNSLAVYHTATRQSYEGQWMGDPVNAQLTDLTTQYDRCFENWWGGFGRGCVTGELGEIGALGDTSVSTSEDLMAWSAIVLHQKEIRTWNGSYNNDLNDASNYDGTGPLLSDNIMLYNSGSVNATMTADLTCCSFTTTADYSGDMGLSSYNLTVLGGDFNLSHPGDLDAGTSVVTLLGDVVNITTGGHELYDFVLEGSGTRYMLDDLSCNDLSIINGSWTANGYNVDLAGDLTIDGAATTFGDELNINGDSVIDTNIISGSLSSTTIVTFASGTDSTWIESVSPANAFYFAKLVLEDNASVNFPIGGYYNIVGYDYPLTMGQDSTISGNPNLHFFGPGVYDTTMWDLGSGYSLQGQIQLDPYYHPTGAANYVLPDINIDGVIYITPTYGGVHRFDVGNVTATNNMAFYTYGGTNTATININGNLNTGREIFFGYSGGILGSTMDVNMGSGTHNAHKINLAYWSNELTGVTINLQKSTIILNEGTIDAGPAKWINSDNVGVTHAWDKLVCNYDTEITSANKYHNWMEISEDATATLIDDFKCRDLINNGTLDKNSMIFSQTGDIIEVTQL